MKKAGRFRPAFPLFFHHGNELIEQVMRIMWTWRRLGVVLNRKGRLVFPADTLDCIIIQIDVRQFYVIRILHFVGTNCETVVLRRDLAFAGDEVLHRVV